MTGRSVSAIAPMSGGGGAWPGSPHQKMTSWLWSRSRAASMSMLQASAPRVPMGPTSREDRTFVLSSEPD
jgi:hypothetical protein